MRRLPLLLVTVLLVALSCLGHTAPSSGVVALVADDEQQDESEGRPRWSGYDGIDVSDHQKRIDWAEVARDKNVQYVYIKATEGATYVSSLYRYNLEQARKHGIKVGSYHFLRTGSLIRDQFENFKRVVKKHEQDLLPLIDVEVRQGWTNQQLRDSVKLFADLVEEHYGCRPMIYTSSSFYDNILGRAFNIYPLFIARYSDNEPALKSGNDWIMWQYSERGRVRGISTNVDLSRFNKGRSINDILIRGQRINQKRRSGSDMVDKRDKPGQVKVKEAPAMSKQQERELKKKQEKEQKARERAQKLAEEEAKKKAEQDRKQREKEQKARERADKQKEKDKEKEQKQQARQARQQKEANAREQEHQRQLQQRAEQERLEKEEQARKEAEREAEKQAALKAKQQRQQRARQAEQQKQAQQQAKQQQKQAQRDKLQQQKQQSQSQPTRTRATGSTAGKSTKKTNKSSADND